MASRRPELILLVPRLAAELPGMEAPGFPWPETPGLDRLLSRARQAPGSSHPYDAVFGLLTDGVQGPDWPAAAPSYLADTGREPPGPLLRADPVHLRADPVRLRLFDASALAIRAEEAEALACAFNEAFDAEGLRLETACPERWYLHLPSPERIEAQAPRDLLGRPVDDCLPRGSRAWAPFLNEIQMLFHAHEVNRRREAEGRPVINSLWPWGGGEMPQPRAGVLAGVWTDDAIARGLAILAGVTESPTPVDAEAWRATAGEGRHLVWLDGLAAAAGQGHVESWLAALSTLEETWFKPLSGMLGRGRLASLKLWSCNSKSHEITMITYWNVFKPSRHFSRNLR